MEGDGQGNFVTVNSYPLGGNGTNVVIADFNGDNHPDVAVDSSDWAEVLSEYGLVRSAG